ncbi:MAG: hypothetical protein KDL31_06815 [Kiritimatiellae bacterium]|nr:hypothetical protein [Kiritimatiellia bacterium]
MAGSGISSWMDQAIDAGSREIIPVLVLVDESSFAERVAENLLDWVPESVRSAWIVAPISEWSEHWAAMSQPSFRTQIHPARLWEGQPPWVLIAADLARSQPGPELLDVLHGVAEVGAPGAFVVPIFKGDLDMDAWGRARQAISFLPTPCFFLSDRAALKRSDALLARGSAGFILAGWEQYLRERTGNWREALGLAGAEQVFSLGVAADEPDWGFHGYGWIDAALQEVAGSWIATGGSPDRPAFPKADEVAAAHAPSRNYRVKRDAERTGPALGLGQVEMRYEFVSPPTVPEFRTHEDRTRLSDRIQRLRAFHYGLHVSEQGTAERLLAKRSREWRQELRSLMVGSFCPPDQPLGLLRWFRGLLDLWKSYFDGLSGVDVRLARGISDFDANLKRMIAKEARVPSLGGVVLRVFLLAVGCFWTVWGTFFWANRVYPWNDPGMLRAFWLSVGSLIVVILAVFIHYGWTHMASMRAEAITRRDLLRQYLGGLVASVRDRIVDGVSRFRSELDHWASGLEEVHRWASEVASGREGIEETRPPNQNPRFPAGALDEVRSRRLPDLAAKAHRKVAAKLLDDERWPVFEVTIWRELVLAAIREEVGREIGQIAYDEAVSAAAWTDTARGYLVTDLIRDARKPAFEADAAMHAPVILLGSSEWTAHVPHGNGIRLSGHQFPFLAAVAIMPLRHPKLDGEGRV